MPIRLNPLKNKGFSSLEISESGENITFILNTMSSISYQYEDYFESLLEQCRLTNAEVNFFSDERGLTFRISGNKITLRKIFDIILEEKRYPKINNSTLHAEKSRLFPQVELPKNSIVDSSFAARVPSKGKILAVNDNALTKKSVQITKELRLIGSSMSYIGEGRKPHKSDRHVLKENRSRDMDSSLRHEATMIEAFYFELGRLTNPIEMVPKASSVHDPQKAYKGVMLMVKNVEGFRSLDEIYQTEKRALSQQEFIEKKIASILVDAFLSMENDCRGGNIGENKEGALKRLDFGQSGWPLTAPYTLLHSLFYSDDYSVDRLGIRIRPQDAFPLSEEDIVNFPQIIHAKPVNWLYRTKLQKEQKINENMAGLDGIEHNPEFIKQKYFYFLKRTLIDPEIIKGIGRATIAEELVGLRQKHVQSQIARMEKIKSMLPNIAQFREYFDKFRMEYEAELIDEITKYNAQYRAKPGETEFVKLNGETYKAKYKDRLIDLSAISHAFNNLVACVSSKLSLGN